MSIAETARAAGVSVETVERLADPASPMICVQRFSGGLFLCLHSDVQMIQQELRRRFPDGRLMNPHRRSTRANFHAAREPL